MEKNLEIKKLEDVVVWFDNWIEETKLDLTEEEMEDDETIKEFETIKKVILKSIERHAVYTTALNNDIADKAAKIDLLEKEIEGRKEGYTALKELMDTKYISIDEHNKICEDFKKKIVELEKESEKWQDLAKMNRDTICDQYSVCEDFKNKISELEEKVKRQKENLDGINKTLETRNKEIDSLVKTLQTTRREIEAHEEESKKLENRIKELKEENSYLKKASENKNDIIRKAYTRYVDEACKGREEIMDECYKNLTKDDTGYLGFKQYTLRALKKKEGDEKEAKKFICDSADIIFYNKKAEERRTEETEVKDFDEYHKYNWFPCGEDAIE